MNDNSTVNSYLRPAALPAPLDGDGLNDFLQAWIVGITGMPADMVRPAWQSEPPNVPDAGDVWAAFALTNVGADVFPYVAHDPVGDGSDRLQRHERMTMLTSFYDLGSGGEADKFASLFRDGTAIEQNAQQLHAGGMALVSVGDLLTVPALLKLRWQYRVDVPVRIARQVDRTYPVFSIREMQGELLTDEGITRPLAVTHP